MSQTGPIQETSNIDTSQENGEWKTPIGILLLKSTYVPPFGRLKTVELGVITGDEIIEGKKVYNFCRLADLFYTESTKNPDSRVEVKPLLDNTLNQSGKYSDIDGRKIEYKFLYEQDDMIDFVKKLNLHNRHRLLEILRDRKTLLSINEHMKLLLTTSLEKVIIESSPYSRNHRH